MHNPNAIPGSISGMPSPFHCQESSVSKQKKTSIYIYLDIVTFILKKIGKLGSFFDFHVEWGGGGVTSVAHSTREFQNARQSEQQSPSGYCQDSLRKQAIR